jgi:hypothetical protein
MPLNADNSTSALERIAATKSATQRQANRAGGSAAPTGKGGAAQAEDAANTPRALPRCCAPSTA